MAKPTQITGAQYAPPAALVHASSKLWDIGLSCAFRQHRSDTHCRFMHGYNMRVEVEFRATELDNRNWVMDFGGLKGVKGWLEKMYDHKTLVARDDPYLTLLRSAHQVGVIDMREVDNTGCEAMSKEIFLYVHRWLHRIDASDRVWLERVQVWEREANSAACYRGDVQ